MTTNDAKQISAIRSKARAWGSRDRSTADTAHVVLAGVEAEVDAALLAAMGAGRLAAFLSAPSRIEAYRAARGNVVRLAGSPA